MHKPKLYRRLCALALALALSLSISPAATSYASSTTDAAASLEESVASSEGSETPTTEGASESASSEESSEASPSEESSEASSSEESSEASSSEESSEASSSEESSEASSSEESESSAGESAEDSIITGWVTIDDAAYYILSDGTYATGSVKIDDIYYIFNSEGVLQNNGKNSVTKVGSKYYAANKYGKALTGWRKVGGKKYYAYKSNGLCYCNASKKIDDIYYIFSSTANLCTGDETAIYQLGDSYYCADENGAASFGWNLLGSKLYYAATSGKLKVSTTYQGITFKSNGVAKKGSAATAKKYVMKVFASITTEDMTKTQKLKACWKYCTSSKFRYLSKYPDLTSSTWQWDTAYDMLSTKKGNCYSFACAFAALASECGYDAKVVCGRVKGNRDGASDGMTRHSWVMIGSKHYDPEAQFAGWYTGCYGKSSYSIKHTMDTITYYRTGKLAK